MGYQSAQVKVANYDLGTVLLINTPINEALAGMKVSGFYVIRKPSAVNLQMRFGPSQVPFVVFQGNVFNFGAFGDCAYFTDGIYLMTDTTTADFVQIMWFYSPIEVVTGQ
jgi:hypothetical protein